MSSSSAMKVVVTCGSPKPLKSLRLVSRMRSRVRRFGLRSMAWASCGPRRIARPPARSAGGGGSAREPALEVVQRVAEPRGGLRRPAEEPAPAQAAHQMPVGIGERIEAQPDAVAGEDRGERVAPREQLL